MRTLPTRRQLLYIQGLLTVLAFAILIQQLIATRYFFQVEQVLHHETVAIFLIALAIGITIGATRRD